MDGGGSRERERRSRAALHLSELCLCVCCSAASRTAVIEPFQSVLYKSSEFRCLASCFRYSLSNSHSAPVKAAVVSSRFSGELLSKITWCSSKRGHSRHSCHYIHIHMSCSLLSRH